MPAPWPTRLLLAALLGSPVAVQLGCTVGYPAGSGPPPGIGLGALQQLSRTGTIRNESWPEPMAMPANGYSVTPELAPAEMESVEFESLQLAPVEQEICVAETVPAEPHRKPLRDLMAQPPAPATPPSWFNPVPVRPAFYPQ